MSQPYDQQGKILMEEEARVVLHLFGALPLDADADVVHLDRELNLGTRRADHVYRVSSNGRDSIEHFEVTTSFRHLDFDSLFDYPVLLEMKYRIACNTRILLMTDRNLPAHPPARHRIYLGGSTERIHDVNLVRIWEIPAESALEIDRRSIWPWVMLMKATPAEQQEAMRRVARTQDQELVSRLAVLTGLRYGKEGAWRILEFMDNLITREMMLESSVVQTWIEQGVEQGIEKGIEKGIERGRREGEARALRVILSNRFGVLPAWVDQRINATSSAELETLIVRALQASTLGEVFS